MIKLSIIIALIIIHILIIFAVDQYLHWRKLTAYRHSIDISDWRQMSGSTANILAGIGVAGSNGKTLAAGECMPHYQRYDTRGNQIGSAINGPAVNNLGKQVCPLNGAFVDVIMPDGSRGNIEGVDWVNVVTPDDRKRCQTNWRHYDNTLKIVGGPYLDVAVRPDGSQWCPRNDSVMFAIDGINLATQ